jgi:HEAT repeat protein
VAKLELNIERMLQAENEDERLQAVKALAATGVEHQLDILYQAMGDTSWRVRKEAVELFLRIPNAATLTGEIIELLHSQENAGLRNAAVEILVKFGRQATSQLLEELSCNDHDVRKFILDVLGDIGDERAVDGMLAALADEDTNVRAAAAENLGKLKARDAAPALLRAMQSGDLMFKFTALEALALMQARIRIEELLFYQDESLLRKALFDCLGRIGDAAAVPVLVGALTDSMRNVAEAAAEALARLAERGVKEVAQALSQLAGSSDVAHCCHLLDSRSESVRHSVVTLLGYVGDDTAVSCLFPLLEEQDLSQPVAAALITIGHSNPSRLISLWQEASVQQRVYLAYLFGEAGCVDCRVELHQGLRDREPSLRHAAAQSLGQLGDKTALPVLIECLGDESADVRDAIVAALSKLGKSSPAETLAAIYPLLEDEKPEQRASAVTVLGRLAGMNVEQSLTFALKDESAEVRRAAVRALDGRGSDEQLQALMLALTDEDVEVRRIATEILGQCRGEGLIEALQLGLQDEDIWVRSTAVRSLGYLGTPDALRKVEAALLDPVGLVVISALETLCENAPEAVSVHLLSALNHADEEVVNSSLKQLSQLDSVDWAASHGEQLLNHKNWEVRLSAARSLAACQGGASMPLLEARLLIEGEDLVRLELQDLLVALNEDMD